MRSCVTNDIIEYLEGWKEAQKRFNLDPVNTPFLDGERGWFYMNFYQKADYSLIEARCKAAFHSPAMRQILEA